MAPTAYSTAASPPTAAPARDSTKIVLRQFHNEDLDQVIQLFKEGMLYYPGQRNNGRLHQFIDESLKTDLSDIAGTYVTPGGNFWIATPRDEPSLVVGMVGLELKPNLEAELRRMSVKMEHQLQKIWLTTGAVMDKARNFYDSKGNVETDQYFMSVDPPYEVVRIEKVLAPAVDKNAAL
ncbi:hypothetical protein PHYSODRAFT_299957 [Phytophthora sojae]|uniref:N-acetyltransferase domain-containing protein n=1 Tax=Phytophthora sojae (strain P6497) TaxID=1094619 RepID=G4ZEK6_PHYSP|nr:hypothetical protein PHYSODRAFT_299957 [Phytophthora sojae]EGZ16529.1 hypothetical protein PHYSODRAFT_299957 [Phytophthora sojae]|eukprot:XP_009525587.1 hypothetical protein PHYSODRAFT_299957 [Phytophthora sojae]